MQYVCQRSCAVSVLQCSQNSAGQTPKQTSLMQCWLSFEQEFGLEISQGPFQPEQVCESVINVEPGQLTESQNIRDGRGPRKII